VNLCDLSTYVPIERGLSKLSYSATEYPSPSADRTIMGSISVLVATQNAASRAQLERCLAEWGYRVTSAVDGEAAQALLREKSFDICLFDWEMPGANGFEICRQLRSSSSETTPLVILCASPAQVDDIISREDAGANDYITEPFDLRHLRHRMAGLAQIVVFRQDPNIQSMRKTAPTGDATVL